jgi:hypothetical protein
MREHGRASLGRIVTDRENPLTILGHAPDELTRAHRAQQLAMSLDEAGLLALTRALMTPDADLRASILAVLTVRKYATAKGVARALVDDPHVRVREHALRLLAAVVSAADASTFTPLTIASDDEPAMLKDARRALSRALTASLTADPNETRLNDVDDARHALVVLLRESALPDLALVRALHDASGPKRQLAVAALGALEGESLGRAFGGAFAVVDEEGRALLADVARRRGSSLPLPEREGLVTLLSDPPSSKLTLLAFVRAFAAVDAKRLIPFVLDSRAIVDDDVVVELASSLADVTGHVQLCVDDVLRASDKHTLLPVALAPFIDNDDLLLGLLDDDRRARLMRAWRLASTDAAQSRVTSVSRTAFARLGALVGRDDGALPIALSRALLAEGTVMARLALVELARALEDEEAARALVLLTDDEAPAVREAARAAMTGFVSRAVRFDRRTDPPTLELDYRAPSGELLVEHGGLLADQSGLRYALDEEGTPLAIRFAARQTCVCCRRTRYLITETMGLVCPLTGARHVTDGDRSLLAEAHPLGACPACPTALPLVERGGHVVCSACGWSQDPLPPERTLDEERERENAALAADLSERAVVGVPPAPRPVELGLYRPTQKQIMAAHVFVTTTDAVLGAGIVLSLDEQTGVCMVLVGAAADDIARVAEEGARLYTVNGERSVIRVVVVDRELGLALVSCNPRRAERIATCHEIGMWPAKSRTVLVPGGLALARWEIAQVKLVVAADDPMGHEARLKPSRLRPGSGVYSTTGGLIGVVGGEAKGAGVLPLSRVVPWLALHHSDLAALLRKSVKGEALPSV